MSDTSADTPNAQLHTPRPQTEAAAILLESARAQHVLDGLGILALAAGTALILSVPEAVIVTASLTAVTLTARRFRARITRARTRTSTKRAAPQLISGSDTFKS